MTYPLHIVLRMGLELRLLDRSLAVRDLPQAWRDEAERLIGARARDRPRARGRCLGGAPQATLRE
jgi:carboxypeptidase Taq